MTTSFNIRTFGLAGWSESIQGALSQAGCTGLELSTTGLSSGVAQWETFDSLQSWVADKLTLPQQLIITGNPIAQPDSHRSRHIGIQIFLDDQLPHRDCLDEETWSVVKDSRIKHFAAFKRGGVSSEQFINASRRWRTTWMIAAPARTSPADLRSELGQGWEDDYPAVDAHLLRAASRLGLILMRDLGQSDIGEVGAVAIGPTDLLLID